MPEECTMEESVEVRSSWKNLVGRDFVPTVITKQL